MRLYASGDIPAGYKRATPRPANPRAFEQAVEDAKSTPPVTISATRLALPRLSPQPVQAAKPAPVAPARAFQQPVEAAPPARTITVSHTPMWPPSSIQQALQQAAQAAAPAQTITISTTPVAPTPGFGAGTDPQWLDWSLGEISAEVYDWPGQPRTTPTVPGWTRVPDSQLGRLNLSPETLMNGATGLQASVYTDAQKHYVVAFAGTQNGSDILADLAQPLPPSPFHNPPPGQMQQFDEAVSITRRVANAVGRQNVITTGNSLGGALAAVSAVAAGVDAVTFNASGPSNLTLQSLTGLSPKIAESYADEHVRSYVVDREPLNSAQDSGLLPGSSLGKRITLPTPTWVSKNPIVWHTMQGALPALQAFLKQHPPAGKPPADFPSAPSNNSPAALPVAAAPGNPRSAGPSLAPPPPSHGNPLPPPWLGVPFPPPWLGIPFPPSASPPLASAPPPANAPATPDPGQGPVPDFSATYGVNPDGSLTTIEPPHATAPPSMSLGPSEPPSSGPDVQPPEVINDGGGTGGDIGFFGGGGGGGGGGSDRASEDSMMDD